MMATPLMIGMLLFSIGVIILVYPYIPLSIADSRMELYASPSRVNLCNSFALRGDSWGVSGTVDYYLRFEGLPPRTQYLASATIHNDGTFSVSGITIKMDGFYLGTTRIYSTTIENTRDYSFILFAKSGSVISNSVTIFSFATGDEDCTGSGDDPECLVNSDCPSGYECRNGVCVYISSDDPTYTVLIEGQTVHATSTINVESPVVTVFQLISGDANKVQDVWIEIRGISDPSYINLHVPMYRSTYSNVWGSAEHPMPDGRYDFYVMFKYDDTPIRAASIMSVGGGIFGTILSDPFQMAAYVLMIAGFFSMVYGILISRKL